MRYRFSAGHRRNAGWARCMALITAAILFGATIQAAGAGELRAFNTVFADAWSHYRAAVFYGRSGNVAVAALELDEFVNQWSALTARFGKAPPDAFADDGSWQATLESISTAARQALARFDAGDAEAAGKILQPIREIAGDLRRRNGVTVYADDVDELGAAMDVLARYRREVTDLADAEARDMVSRQAAVVAYLFEKCDARAPAAIRDDPEFRRLITGARDSMAKLRTSLQTGDLRLYRIGIGELRSYERILFLRFG